MSREYPTIQSKLLTSDVFVRLMFSCPICLCINRAPALVTGVLLMSGEKMPDTIDSAFFYGKQQVTIAVEICSITLF